MKSPAIFAILLLVAAAFVAPCASAQDAIGVLQVDGTVMTSLGGEFTTATTGQGVIYGQRIMVGPGGHASVHFNNGSVANYLAPAVYTVQMPAMDGLTVNYGETDYGVVGPRGGALTSAGIILGSAVLGAGVLSNMDDSEDEDIPVSR